MNRKSKKMSAHDRYMLKKRTGLGGRQFKRLVKAAQRRARGLTVVGTKIIEVAHA